MDLKLGEVTSLIIFNKKQFLDFIHQMVFNLIFCCVTVQAMNNRAAWGSHDQNHRSHIKI